MEPGKVDVAPVHDVNGPGFGDNQVERVDIAHLAVGNVDETRDAALEVKQGVHLHRRLGGAEQRPREHRQAQVDGRRVERVDRVGQFQPQVLSGVELPCLCDQSLGKFRVNAPVAGLVGIGQGRAPHRLLETHVVKLVRLRREAGFDVAQALYCMGSWIGGFKVCCACIHMPQPTKLTHSKRLIAYNGLEYTQLKRIY